MAANRQSLRKQEEQVKKHRDDLNNTKSKFNWPDKFRLDSVSVLTFLFVLADLFKMKKFQNVESKVQMGRP